MNNRITNLVLIVLTFTLLSSCAERTRLDGVQYFLDNYQEFKICLGEGYGCHSISYVAIDGDDIVIKYTYRDGILRGEINEDGEFEGNYSTFTSDGNFYMRFNTNGTAQGMWRTTSSPIEFEGLMSLEK